jgi:hypothetical protein
MVHFYVEFNYRRLHDKYVYSLHVKGVVCNYTILWKKHFFNKIKAHISQINNYAALQYSVLDRL